VDSAACVATTLRRCVGTSYTPRSGAIWQSGLAIAALVYEEHAQLVEADQRFQAALEHAIATGSERIEAVEATVQLKRRTTLSP
jgi:hypothetical protein